ncbi:MAG: hypothetical protein GTO18_14260 [Anaerolineales bacterium]|nr:hypothetical protein [Anaerolineales bacterium]
MSKRKRFNPLEETGRELEASVTHPVTTMGGIPSVEVDLESVERIERLRPSEMVPDRFQPRRLLPGEIRRRFFAQEIDCYQAAREWLKLAKTDTGWKKRVEELLDMGNSFEEQGQIKPITGTWIPSEDGGFIFRIETGERRFWAACLRKVKSGKKKEPELRVEVVSQPTRQRQVIENRHAQDPSAVARACEVAVLMLEELEIKPDPEVEDEYEYFRKALGKRAPRGMWSKLEPIMQHSTRRMQQLLAILQLPSPLLELADRNRIPERVLREVLALPDEQWEESLNTVLREGMTAEDVARMGEKARERSGKDDARRSPDRIAYQGIRRYARAIINAESKERPWIMDSVADEAVVEGLGEALIPLLTGLQERIEIRLKAMKH